MRTRLRLPGALASVLWLIAAGVGAQQITGRVVDAQSGSPMPSVQVFIAGANIGALTQQNGRYLLLNVPTGNHVVTAQRIGYRTVTQQVTVGSGETIVQDFRLAEEALGLDEIIVTGTPGGTQRRAIGNAVTAVNASDIAEVTAVGNVQNLLGARTPGVQFARTKNNVGSGSAIVIRGVGSFNLGSDPLIYVDGIRTNNNSASGPVRGDTREVNPLDDLNPEDIESIEIIKGPAAATLYGTEASAGVVQIITKRGREGTPQFDMSVRMGANYMHDPAKRLGTRWTCTDKFAGVCDVSGAKPFDEEGDDRDYSSRSATLIPYNPYDEANVVMAGGYFEDLFGTPYPQNSVYINGLTQNYNMEFRGGTPTTRYFVSGNYGNEGGIVHYNWDKTVRLRANLGIIFSDNVSVDFSTGYISGKTSFMEQARGQGGEWDDMQWGTGYCFPRINGQPNGGACSRTLGFQEHLPIDIEKVEVTRDYSRFTGSGTVNFTTGGWLSSRAIVGIDKGWDENTTYYPLETQREPVYPESPNGQITLERPVTTNASVDWSATAKHDFTAAIGTATSVGGQYYVERVNTFSNIGVGFPSPLSRTVNQTAPANATIGYEFIENKSLGFYVQEELSWNDRLFLTGAVRFDDNSAFGSNFEPLTYPKLSATWVISEEGFWGVDLVNSLRLRGAWGKAGRQPDTFAGRNQYGVIPGPGGLSIFAPSAPGNIDVGPEVSTEIEVGFDAALMDDRISAEFTYYRQQNEDALLNVGLPPSVGFAGSRQVNLGRLDNWGWEASLRTRIYESPTLSFGIDFTGSHVDNEIMDLGNYPPSSSIRLGYPYPNLAVSYVVLGAEWAASGDTRRLPVNAWGDKVTATCDAGVPLGEGSQYGRVKGGTVIDCADVTAANQMLWGPRFQTYQFGVSPNVGLLNNSVRIFALIDGAWGKVNQDGGVGSGDQYNNTYYSRTESDPLYVATNRCGTCYRGAPGPNLFDAGFVKFRELGVLYTLPESIVGRLGADRASLSVSAREIGTIWAQQDEIWYARVSDPEVSGSRLDDTINRQIPPLSSISATMRVTF